MRILIIGAGAVGGYFGARLAAAGRDVTFLVHAGRAEQLRREGLQILSPYGDFSVPPRLLLAPDLAAQAEAFDLVVISTKSYSLAAAMDDFAPAVGPSTVILPLLNGMGHLDALDQRFGHEKVVGGTTTLVADLDSEGRVRQIERLHDLTFGERVNPDRQEDGSQSPRIQAVDAVLRGANFDAVLSPDVLAVMWQKWSSSPRSAPLPACCAEASAPSPRLRAVRRPREPWSPKPTQSPRLTATPPGSRSWEASRTV